MFCRKPGRGGVVGWARRYVENENIVRVEYNVREAFRGMGLGVMLIEHIVHEKLAGETIVAYVREDNTASEKVFIKCNFKKTKYYKTVNMLNKQIKMYKYIYK